MDTLKSEPVVLGAVIRLIVLAAAHWGFHWDTTQLIETAVALEAVIAPLVRHTVTPVTTPTPPTPGA